MNPFIKIFDTYVIDKLKTLAPEVSVLNGYLVHYADDLLNNKRGLKFPCVAAQAGKDTVTAIGGKGEQGKIEREINIIGAVSAKNPSAVNEQISELAYKVRKTLSINRFTATDVSDIIINDTVYDLPSAGEQYAYFTMKISIIYVEDWK